ncbi:MAG: hypothetical protein OJF49_002025 [Ktedonobacterales bacterium]|nr:MAG: hypothetical protein OJF49_002025 [Ktedonobacterales bacterium]
MLLRGWGEDEGGSSAEWLMRQARIGVLFAVLRCISGVAQTWLTTMRHAQP